MLPCDPIPAARRAIQCARRNQYLSFDEGPVGDLERDAVLTGLPTWLAQRKGYLYLAGNPGVPNLYKIGRTRQSVEQRMKSLNSAGVLVPWHAVLAWEVYDAAGLEALAQSACAEFHVKNELFQAPWTVLAERIQTVIDADQAKMQRYLGGHIETAMTPLVARRHPLQ